MTEDPLRRGSHRLEAENRALLCAVDEASLLHALDAAIHEAEDYIVDVIAEDYADAEDIDEAGEDVIDWELAALREIDGRPQAACLVAVELYRDEDEESSVGTTGGCCWCFIELAQRPWRGVQLTAARSWLAIERRGPVPWTTAPSAEPGPATATLGQRTTREPIPPRSAAGHFRVACERRH
jgi:hypothetical protein